MEVSGQLQAPATVPYEKSQYSLNRRMLRYVDRIINIAQ